jgi:hypothetical protein
MGKVFMVIKSHSSNYSDPIVVRKGEQVMVGEIYNGAENWPDWRFCSKINESQKGWIPEQLLSIGDNNDGTVKEDYSAKELSVEAGQKVTVREKLNGWMWCQTPDGDEGWIPVENLEEQTDAYR